MHWLFYYAIAFALTLLVGIVGTISERRRRKAEKFTPTHRRTRER